MGVHRLSRTNRIVIPKQAREAMKVKAGDEVLVTLKGNIIIVMAKPRSYAKSLYGLAEGVYPPRYLKRERASW